MSADDGVWMVRISRDYQHRVRVAAAEEGLGISEWFERVLDEALGAKPGYTYWVPASTAEEVRELVEKPVRVSRRGVQG